MMDRVQYANILYNTIIPSHLAPNERSTAEKPLLEFIASNIPNALFRFRACNERNIEAFYKDQVWVANGMSMNDGFETRLYFDIEKAQEWLNHSTGSSLIQNAKDMASSSKSIPPEFASIPGVMEGFACFKMIPEKAIETIITEFGKYLREDLASEIRNIITETEKSFKFSCFCESISSPSMWGLYAENESGFALSYDFSHSPLTIKHPDGSSRELTIFPIIYNDKRFKVDIDYIKYQLYSISIWKTMSKLGKQSVAKAFIDHIPCPDDLIPYKIAIHKSSEWETEREWRVFCRSTDTEFRYAHNGFYQMKPTGLYLGRRISFINEKILTDMAKEKSIPVYKMGINDHSPYYDLSVNRIM